MRLKGFTKSTGQRAGRPAYCDDASALTGSTDSYEYDGFGNGVSTSGSTPNNYLYRGEYFDPDPGMYYLRARYYNPLSGRFLSADPLAHDGEKLYEYAEADPVNGLDPTGDAAMIEFLLLRFWPGRLSIFFPPYCYGAGNNPMHHDLPGCGDASNGGTGSPSSPPHQHEVTVSFWPQGAARFGHIGVGVDSPPDHEQTHGFATLHEKSRFRNSTCIPQRGAIVIDQDVKNYWGKPVDYMRIEDISDAQATAMKNEMASFPSGWYDDCFWNCATFVAKVLNAGGIPNVPPYSNAPIPLFFYILHSADGYSYYRATNY